MKKLLYPLLAFAALAACTNNDFSELVVNTKPDTPQYDPNRRSYNEALEIAQNSINMLGSNDPTTRGAEPVRTINLKNGVKAYRQPVTRSNGIASTNDTLLYVFNFNDDQGFAVVSASRQTDGLIAVTESGYYDPSVPTGNPGFDTYMQMAKAYVAYKDRTPVEDEKVGGGTRYGPDQPMYMPMYDTVYCRHIYPKITVKWGQGGRAGQFCPNNMAGCGPVAAAQIMSYFKHPSSMNLYYQDHDVNTTALDWTNMCNHVFIDTIDNRDEYDLQIGRLCRQVGKYSSARYNTYTHQTSTDIRDVRDALQILGYTVSPIRNYVYTNPESYFNQHNNYYYDNILQNDSLILMVGDNSDGVSHSWAIDGCLYVRCNYYLMCSYDGENWFVDHLLASYSTTLNHINWGWDSERNGYFDCNVFNAYNRMIADPNSHNNISPNLNLDFYINVQYFTITY
ncbi:MAG: C10 family peptidase [Prevotella sp.]|nr:C10 family peptidase [Prevotella sp.]